MSPGSFPKVDNISWTDGQAGERSRHQAQIEAVKEAARLIAIERRTPESIDEAVQALQELLTLPELKKMRLVLSWEATRLQAAHPLIIPDHFSYSPRTAEELQRFVKLGCSRHGDSLKHSEWFTRRSLLVLCRQGLFRTGVRRDWRPEHRHDGPGWHNSILEPMDVRTPRKLVIYFQLKASQLNFIQEQLTATV